jgi:hypothetical protein
MAGFFYFNQQPVKLIVKLTLQAGKLAGIPAVPRQVGLRGDTVGGG